MKILKIKQRPVEKGLILVASCINQLRSYIDFHKLTDKHLKILYTSWPGYVTFLMPASPNTPAWLTGYRSTIAVRVSQHPSIIQLCQELCRPLVSTSANLTGEQPCRSAYDVQHQFGLSIPILHGKIGRYQNPSEIRDIVSDKLIRQG
jgi:L-threonylcarbamoyladenylate synthase